MKIQSIIGIKEKAFLNAIIYLWSKGSLFSFVCPTKRSLKPLVPLDLGTIGNLVSKI
jgi:hypothetical protein